MPLPHAMDQGGHQSEAPTRRIPARIGKFAIEDELGRGAMGVVYRAFDPDLARSVALKVIATHLASPDAWNRFRREAQSIARLRHPNIVQVYEFGDADGSPFIAMEYLEGTNLHEARLAGARPPGLARALKPILDVCHALECAHSSGIVHRDIKPSNIRLLPDHRACLIDFGLASLLGADLTVSGQLVGTPAYLAPEGYRTARVDARADIFSLAVTCFEWLSDRRPFDGGTPLQIGTEKLLSLDQCLIDAPAGLSAVLARAMSSDPEDRFQTMAAFREALECALVVDDRPRPTLVEVPDRRGRRLPKPTQLFVAASVALLLGSVLAISWPRPAAIAGAADAPSAVVSDPDRTEAPPPVTSASPVAKPGMVAPRTARSASDYRRPIGVNRWPGVPAPVKTAAPPAAVAAPESHPAPPVAPVGTPLSVQITSVIRTDRARVGDAFSGSLAEAVIVDGQEYLPAGTAAKGRVEFVGEGRQGTGAALELGLTEIIIRGVPTAIRSGFHRLSAPDGARGRSHVLAIVAGAAIGGITGGLIDNSRGAAGGALIGGVAGAALAGKSGSVAVYSIGNIVTFKLAEELALGPFNP